MAMRYFRGAVLLGGLGIAAALGGTYATDDGTRRAVKLWTELGPVIAHYRAVEMKQKYFGPRALSPAADAEWDDLHERYSSRVLKTLQDLRGFYVKVGQVIASRKDMMPPVYVEKLRTLEDQVPSSADPGTIESVVRASFEVEDLSSVFEDFSAHRPVATASIGQVFRARLKENPRAVVAVKVQLPGIEQLFRGDIRTAKAFCAVMAPEQVIVFDEIERQFMTEFDYRMEAEHLDQVRRNMKQFKDVVVPKPWLKYCTKEVLVMDFLPGPKLIDGIRLQGRRWAAKKGISFEDFEKEIMAKYEREGLPPTYDAPNARLMDMYLKLFGVRDLLLNSSLWLYNMLARLINYLSLGVLPLPNVPFYESFVPLNSARIMETLLRVHGHQILVDGYFNADPHAGNFLLLPDERIGLIDYGQVKRFSRHDRLELAKVIAAMYENNEERIVELVKANGYTSKYSDPEVIRKMVVVVLDQDGRDVTGGLNFQQFMDKMYETDPWEKTGDMIIMPTRVSFLLRSIGLMMNNPVSVVRVWGPIAKQVLKAEGIEE